MTVKEFRQKLKNVPDNAEIMYWDGDNGGWTEVSDIDYSTTLDISGFHPANVPPKIIHGAFVLIE